MRTLVMLIALSFSSTVAAESLEIRVSDYKVPCVRQSETWVCAGELSEQPTCIDVDASRMVCTGTPADSPFHKAAAIRPDRLFDRPF